MRRSGQILQLVAQLVSATGVVFFMILGHFMRIDDCLLEREKVHLTTWGQQAGQLGEESFKMEVAR